MATLYPARLKGQQFERLANLGLIRHDLEEVLAHCGEIERLLAEEAKSQVVRAVWALAIVTYWRCFRSRQIQLRSSDVFGGNAELLDMHRRIGVIRDKVIAHPSKLWEDAYVTVSVRCDDEGKCTILDTTPQWGGRMVIHSATIDVPILRARPSRNLQCGKTQYRGDGKAHCRDHASSGKRNRARSYSEGFAL